MLGWSRPGWIGPLRLSGAGLARETLVPLFRYGTIRRIDQVYEFRLDRKRLAESPSTRARGEELREVLRPLEPLPSTIGDYVKTCSIIFMIPMIRTERLDPPVCRS